MQITIASRNASAWFLIVFITRWRADRGSWIHGSIHNHRVSGILLHMARSL